jgi:hypothetical protein
MFGECVMDVSGTEMMTHLWLREVIDTERLAGVDHFVVLRECDVGSSAGIAAFNGEADKGPLEVINSSYFRSLEGWVLAKAVLVNEFAVDILEIVLVDTEIVAVVLFFIPVTDTTTGIVEVSVHAAGGEEYTVAVDLCPESVNDDFWELQELEGHQVVFPVEPSATVGEDEWLLDLTLALYGTSVNADKIFVTGISVLPNLTAILSGEEVEVVDGVVLGTWGAEIATSGVAEWTEVPTSVIVSPSE